jgi:hypothetical protein
MAGPAAVPGVDPSRVSTPDELAACLDGLRRRRSLSYEAMEKAAAKLRAQPGGSRREPLPKSTVGEIVTGKTSGSHSRPSSGWIRAMATLGIWLGPIIAAIIAVIGIPAGLRFRSRRGRAIRRIAERLASEDSTDRGYPDEYDKFLDYYQGGADWQGTPGRRGRPGGGAAGQPDQAAVTPGIRWPALARGHAHVDAFPLVEPRRGRVVVGLVPAGEAAGDLAANRQVAEAALPVGPRRAAVTGHPTDDHPARSHG